MGDFSLIKHIIDDKNNTRLIGINTSSSPAPIRPPQQQLPLQGASSSSGASSRNSVYQYPQPVSKVAINLKIYDIVKVVANFRDQI